MPDGSGIYFNGPTAEQNHVVTLAGQLGNDLPGIGAVRSPDGSARAYWNYDGVPSSFRYGVFVEDAGGTRAVSQWFPEPNWPPTWQPALVPPTDVPEVPWVPLTSIGAACVCALLGLGAARGRSPFRGTRRSA